MPREDDGTPALRKLDARAASLEADLSGRNAAADRLRESEERYRELFRNLQEAFALGELVRVDGVPVDLRLLEANPAAARLAGVPEEDLVGRLISDVFPGTRFVERHSAEFAEGQASGHEEVSAPRLGRWLHVSYFALGEERIAILVSDVTDRKRAEEELGRSEERLRLVLKGSNDGWWDWDLATDTMFLSPRWWQMLGYSPTELPSNRETWHTLTHPEDVGRVGEAYRSVLEGHAERFEVESRRKHKDGHWVLVLTRGHITKDAAGTPVRISGTTTDLTERKRIEEAARASEALLNSVIDDSPHPMWISDSEGTLIRLNEACRKLLHITSEEVVGKYNVFRDNIVEEQGFLPLVRRVFEAGETARFELRYDTARLQDVDLANSACVFIDVTIFPVRGLGGKVAHAVIQHVDVTERRKAEDALRASEERFRAMVETTNVGVWAVDREGRTSFVNARMAEMLGYEPSEALGRSIYDFIPESDLPSFREVVERRLMGQRETFERRFLRRDGGIVWAIVSSTPSMTADGRFGGVFATLTDITDRKRAEERMRAQAEMLDAAPSAITVYDSEGRYLYANRRTFELHGYEEREFMELNLRDVDAPASAALIDERVRKVAADGEATFEVVHFRKDRSTIPFEVFAKQVEWAGRPALLSIATDITERKRAEEELAGQVDELRRWYTATLGRERRIAELKREVNQLAERLGLPLPYAGQATDVPPDTP